MFSKPKDDKAANPVASSSQRSERAGRSSGTATPSIIGSDVRIVGNFSTLGEVQVDGEIEGDLHCGSLTMGDQGSVSGSIEAEQAIIKGRVDGRIRAKKVRLEKTAVINGDLFHDSLSVEAGARLSGQVVHSSQEAGTKKDKPATGAAATSLNPTEQNGGAKPVKAVG